MSVERRREGEREGGEGGREGGEGTKCEGRRKGTKGRWMKVRVVNGEECT